MTEAFVAFVRFEEKLLLLKRNSSTEHFPDLWDGVWGVADTPEEVLDRVACLLYTSPSPRDEL